MSIAGEIGIATVVLCAKLEEELSEMSPEEKLEYLQLAGVSESGLAAGHQ